MARLANRRGGFPQGEFEKMTPIGTPELVLLLVALGGMTAAAIWGVTELTNPRRCVDERGVRFLAQSNESDISPTR
jgi:hypothetical protein